MGPCLLDGLSDQTLPNGLATLAKGEHAGFVQELGPRHETQAYLSLLSGLFR